MRRLLFLVFAFIAIAVAVVLLLPKESSGRVDLSVCPEGDVSKMLDCWAEQTNKELARGESPTTLIATLDRDVLRNQGANAQLCHTAMHTTGRWFAAKEKVTLTTLQNYIPRSDNSNCSAGFTHGMISVIGVNPDNAKPLLLSCAREQTRARRTFCSHGLGHAFRRNYLDDDDLAKTIAACDRLGPTAASDCAQGAYHDYLFAVAGIDDTKKLVKVDRLLQRRGPLAAAEICHSQPQRYQSECWFRVFYFYRSSFPVDGVKSLSQFCLKQAPRSSSACFAAGIATFVESYDYVTECQGLRGERAEDCFSGIYLKSLEVGTKSNMTAKAILERQRNISFAMKRCLLMPDKRGERACAYWLSYYSVSGQPANLSDKQARQICRFVNSEFRKVCLKATAEAQRRDLRSLLSQQGGVS